VNDDLLWYYCDSAAELGMRASWPDGMPHGEAEQRWPTPRQCHAARRQKRIAEALRQLSPMLRGVLECCYDGQRVSPNELSRYSLTSHLIEKAIRLGLPRKDQPEFVRRANVLVATAHRAFLIAYRPKGRLGRARGKVQRWLIQSEPFYPCEVA